MSMIIECVDNDGFEDFLTVGRVYQVKARGTNGYQVRTDKGRLAWYGGCKFRLMQ
jgi:hypothetical protein